MGMEPTDKRKPGRPPTGKKTIQYSVTFSPEVAALADKAKQDGGLSAVVADCLRQRYAPAEPPSEKPD